MGEVSTQFHASTRDQSGGPIVPYPYPRERRLAATRLRLQNAGKWWYTLDRLDRLRIGVTELVGRRRVDAKKPIGSRSRRPIRRRRHLQPRCAQRPTRSSEATVRPRL